MRVGLVCVGRMSRESAPLTAHYLRLLQPYATIDMQEVGGVPLSRGPAKVRAQEGADIVKRLRAGAFVTALDRRGRQMSSEEFSAALVSLKLAGYSDFQFIVGGALGLGDEVLAAAQQRLSFGPMTFPHQLARCMLLEQLYRAFRIERGEPYHY